MPLINLEYDNSVVSEKDAKELSLAIKKIVSDETGIDDVFVYANSAKIKVQIAPIEIFVRMSREKISDRRSLVAGIKTKLLKWKKISSFVHLINLTLIPMDWNVETGI